MLWLINMQSLFFSQEIVLTELYLQILFVLPVDFQPVILVHLRTHTLYIHKRKPVGACGQPYYTQTHKHRLVQYMKYSTNNLNAHLHSLHVIDSPACVCSHSIEDTAHFFLYCPLYYTQRLALQNIVSRHTEFKLETLLFGDTNIDNVDNITIILSVHDYIKNSERF